MKQDVKEAHAIQAERGHKASMGALLREVANPTGPVNLPTYAVAGVPAAADYSGHIIYVSDGAAGSPILAFSDGTNWLRSDTGAAIAAS